MQGRVALIAGGSRGIGKAIGLHLGLAGASVMLVSRRREALEAARDELLEAGVERCDIEVGHVGNPDDADRCVGSTVDRLGRLDVLVNNAATNPYFGPLMGLDLERAWKTLEVNLLAALVWSQAAWRHWMQAHGGTVINVSSAGSMTTETGVAFYAVTKAALNHLTRQLAAELAPGVRVHAIAPGLVKTDLARALWEPDEHAIAAHMPMGRLGEPADIGKLATFLAGPDSSWMTGQTVVVDGGFLIRPTKVP